MRSTHSERNHTGRFARLVWPRKQHSQKQSEERVAQDEQASIRVGNKGEPAIRRGAVNGQQPTGQGKEN